jgi:hypothetical protein
MPPDDGAAAAVRGPGLRLRRVVGDWAVATVTWGETPASAAPLPDRPPERKAASRPRARPARLVALVGPGLGGQREFSGRVKVVSRHGLLALESHFKWMLTTSLELARPWVPGNRALSRWKMQF